MRSEPELRNDVPVWSDRRGPVEVCFAGRSPQRAAAAVVTAASPGPLSVATLQQLHSASVKEATVGPSGDGDALWTDRTELACTVVTADCLPILLGGERSVAAVHAGWRGLVAGIVPAAIAAMGEPPSALVAWIGPAIGPCCYEVGEDVAQEVAGATGRPPLRPPGRIRPYLDLPASARAVLASCGVSEIRSCDLCTRCEAALLHSYRRDGSGAGRNVSWIWRSSAEPVDPRNPRGARP